MSRPTVEVADIFRAQGKNFIDRHRNTIRFQQLKVMHAIMRCRTAALGGHVDICPRCGGDQTISDGKVDGDNLSFVVNLEFNGNKIAQNYKGTVSGSEIKFTREVAGRGNPVEFTAKKQ